MDSTRKVGQEIKRVRMEMGLSQKEFGLLIGKSESQVGAYENADTNIKVETLFEIAKAANIKPEQLITGQTAEKETWDAELRIYGAEDRKQVMAILAMNGYDVGQHKKKATPTGKSLIYYVHAIDRKGNADTSK